MTEQADMTEEEAKEFAVYPKGRAYSIQSLISECASLELHCRDGSWRVCKCVLEKHLPLIAGVATEAYGFAKQNDEKEYMEQLFNGARVRYHLVLIQGMTPDLAEDIRAWARESRHKLARSGWLEDALEPIYFK